MSCYNPLRAFAKVDPSSGKKRITFRSWSPDPLEGKKKLYDLEYGEEILLPCGQCIGCRMDYAHDWSNRLLCELTEYNKEDCYFITLTYDDNYISKRLSPCVDADSGEIIPGLFSLDKKEVQNFMKRLRKRFSDQKGIRFYACGEYGGKNGRPHYHLILFGLHLPDGDLQSIGRSQLGYDYKSSRSLSLAWPFGFNVVAPVTPESIGYTCRYMLKKLKGDDSFVYYNFNLQAPFSLASRKPGLGYNYYRKHPEIFDNGLRRITIGTADGSKSFYPPKYFVRLLEKDRPVLAESYKELRKEAVFDRQKLELLETDLDLVEYLAVKQSKALSQGKTIDSFRNLV